MNAGEQPPCTDLTVMNEILAMGPASLNVVVEELTRNPDLRSEAAFKLLDLLQRRAETLAACGLE
mgnify:CR=1 FL=1